MSVDRMSDAEALMWRLEKDPFLSSTFASITIFDRVPDFDALRANMSRAIWTVPRLRQRVQPAPVNMQAPLWVDDPHFDLDFHVRRTALPKPGTRRSLFDLATVIALDPFDLTRPLWQFYVVEGLRGGKGAIISKMHHAISDGENVMRTSLEYVDFDRDPPPRPPLDIDAVEATTEEAAARSVSGLEAIRDIVAGGLRLPIGVARQVRELLANPAGLPQASQAALETVQGIASQVSEVDRARSPLWVERSLRRRLEPSRARLQPTKDAAKRLGGTLNTAFLTAAAEAAGRYHRELGVPVDDLRASMVISTRSKGSGANAFTLARMIVPTGEMPIADRFKLILAAADEARRGSASASLETLSAVASALPTSLVTRLVRQGTQTVDFATSNVRGSAVPLYVGGAKYLENYPMGPLTGVAFNLTLVSYVDHLDMGLNVDTAAVTEPERLRDDLEQAFKDLAVA
jgi:diacylglycerol O-acyltransferase